MLNYIVQWIGLVLIKIFRLIHCQVVNITVDQGGSWLACLFNIALIITGKNQIMHETQTKANIKNMYSVNTCIEDPRALLI